MNQNNDHVTAMLADLNGGVFMEQIDAALREAALGVAHTGKKGKVTITLDLERIGDGMQVECQHKLAFVRPTAKGKKMEESVSITPLYVSGKGVLSLFPIQHQDPLFRETQRDNAGDATAG